ncbi:unnamed protein product [Blepharisma stoltei]|uniref:Uncharacterized protein n=1 Tax=Blepharisma stoltei TaxID=1481888 RepID=A0AAU9IRA8_9CILI|nr:unnamed protein product [Blepharisma stoltei]
MIEYFVKYDNLLEKLMILSDDPLTIIKFPITEEAAELFELTSQHKEIKEKLWKAIPSLKLLELKIVPSRLSSKRFNLVLFLLIADHLPKAKTHHYSDSLSTEDSYASSFLDRSSFLQQERARLNVPYEQAMELEASMATAYEQNCIESDNGYTTIY